MSIMGNQPMAFWVSSSGWRRTFECHYGFDIWLFYSLCHIDRAVVDPFSSFVHCDCHCSCHFHSHSIDSLHVLPHDVHIHLGVAAVHVHDHAVSVHVHYVVAVAPICCLSQFWWQSVCSAAESAKLHPIRAIDSQRMLHSQMDLSPLHSPYTVPPGCFPRNQCH